MSTPLIDETRDLVARTLAASDLGAVGEAMERCGEAGACDRLVAGVTTANGLQASLAAVKSRVAAELAVSVDGRFERWAILRHAERALARLPSQPVSDSVRRQFCAEIRFVAAPPFRATFDVRRATFVGLCELVTARRFPAGQFHWTRSGLPRSWILKVGARDRLTLMYWVVRRMRGFAPAFVPHLNGHRKNRWLTELEANRSYYRMVESLAYQPDVNGMVAASWLRSPDTAAASPHLAWVNRTILEHGGLVLVMGAADPERGALARNRERQRLYEEGAFTPTEGLVLWPRDAMLAWAARHPEFAD